MKDITGNVLKKISDEKIKPKAKWQFIAKHILAWTGSLFSLALAVLSSSVMIYLFIYNDWGLVQHLQDPLISYIFQSAPYLWIASLILFATLFLYNFKLTKNGYRYRMATLILTGVVVSGALGYSLFALGLGEFIDTQFAEHVPYYEHIMGPRQQFWNQPDQGRMTGMVMERNEDGTYLVEDGMEKTWTVVMPEEAPELEEGWPIRFIGKSEGEVFIAEIAEPAAGKFLDKHPPVGPQGMYLINRMHERKPPVMRIDQ